MAQTLGAMIRTVRLSYGMTVAELARRTQLSAVALSAIEHGRVALPNFAVMASIAQALKVSLDTFAEADMPSPSRKHSKGTPRARTAQDGGVTDTVTEPSHLRRLLEQDLRALEAGEGPDPAHARRMLQEEMRAVIAHAEHVIDAIDKAEQGTGTVALETPCVTDTVTDTTVTDTVTDAPAVAVVTTSKTARPKTAAKPKARTTKGRQ